MGPNARVYGRLYTGSGMDAAAVLSVHSIRTFHPFPSVTGNAYKKFYRRKNYSRKNYIPNTEKKFMRKQYNVRE